MSKSFPEWWKHGQKVRTANDGVLTLNIAEDSEYWLTNNAGKEVSVFSMDILGPASVPEACGMTTDITELALSKSLRKKLNRRLNDAYGFQRTSGGKHTTISLSIAECKSVIAALGEHLALVEALEKAQQRIAELEEAEQKLCAANVTLDARAELAERQLAELESRTVTFKLPFTPEPSAFAPWAAKAFYQFHKDTVKSCVAVFSDACAAAGIKVEAE